MKSVQLADNIIYSQPDPNAEPLFVDPSGRILRFALKPGQEVREHNAPHSPVYIIVLEGNGLFSGGDGQEEPYGPGTLLILETGEPHAIRAEDDDLVFLAILHGVPGPPWHR